MVTTIISFLVVISVLVFVHELGHFMVARWCGVYVKEFSIGMGPTLFKIQGKETVYSIKALPIGGAVQMLGEDGVDKEIDDHELGESPELTEIETYDTLKQEGTSDPRSFINKPAWQRLAIIFAGPLMNFLFAIVIFVVIYLSMGYISTEPVVGDITVDSPAYQAGLYTGDTIQSINGQAVKTWQDISKLVNENNGDVLMLDILRDSQSLSINLTPQYNEKHKRYLIGIAPVIKHGAGGAIKLAFDTTWHYTKEIASFIPKLVTGQIKRNEVAGPIGIAQISGEAASKGPLTFFSFLSIISINLGIMNLLPIPALDGGRILLILFEIVLRRKLNPKIEERIHLVGFALLMMLMVFVFYNDIMKVIQGS